MTFQNLKYIIEIANCHSISQAAKNLYMTQSAVYNAVKETEKEVGIRINAAVIFAAIDDFPIPPFP